ncbi:hypothetical protein ABN154_21525 [Klebsiella michiganensis]|uniref:hypothetical protein n=1 Tax=Klebsiella michiganensis TaxID=1134687 RepID=UPI0032DAB152
MALWAARHQVSEAKPQAVSFTQKCHLHSVMPPRGQISVVAGTIPQVVPPGPAHDDRSMVDASKSIFDMRSLFGLLTIHTAHLCLIYAPELREIKKSPHGKRAGKGTK